jgi:ferredoxin
VADVGPAPVAAPGDEPERSPDEAWIETVRCSTCNECTQINDRVFAYDENQQAYIKDLAAGSYRELIEAAESCQLAIIHPGKPRDPNEPGLKDLLERAEPFL